MKFIVIDSKTHAQWSFNLSRLFVSLALLGVFAMPVLVGLLGYNLGLGDSSLTTNIMERWQSLLREQHDDIEAAKSDMTQNLDASALKIAQLQARIVRLDALGERLTEIAGLDDGEFDFSLPPALGGVDADPMDSTAIYQPPAWADMLSGLTAEISDREQQLSLLESLMVTRKMQKEVTLTGRPIQKGWMSSRFGYRNDPITGKRAWHRGVDFAGKEGSNVVAVGSGVVTFAGRRNQYGLLVEVDHGGGYMTRYAHHREVLVNLGDIVHKGEAIALMGNTGRSTGPHVHFEVFKDGRAVDPATYIRRRSR